jgi:uncharacterized protein (TIGR02266 family)
MIPSRAGRLERITIRLPDGPAVIARSPVLEKNRLRCRPTVEDLTFAPDRRIDCFPGSVLLDWAACPSWWLTLADHFRRTDPRYERRLEVEMVADGRRQVGYSRNISLGGMYLEASEPLPVQTTVQIRFRVPTQPEPIDVTGEVRWVEKGAPDQATGMGVRFHGLRARDVWALNRFFQT